MQGSAFDALVKDIAEHGVREAIWVYRGEVVDGANRLRACEQLGIPCPTREYEGRESELPAFVVSMNLQRRDLDESQRAMIAAEIANMSHGGNRKTDQGLNLDLETAADMVNVSRASAAMAKKVRDNAEPEVVEAVKSGELAVSAAAKLVGQTPGFQRRVVAKIEDGTAKSAIDALRLIKREDMAVAPPLPAGQYRLVYSDPPWKYGDSGLQQYGHSSFHYPSMSIEELCELDIADHATDDAILFLWVTAPLLEESFRVIKSWDFVYKANFVWDKVKHNFGHYNSVRHEHLLICTRGSCTPDNPKLYDSVQVIERSDEHSEKPEEFRAIIDNLYPHKPGGRNDRIELFPREKPPKHWDFWSNEVHPDDEGSVQ
jgi:N6-adenosine-specific RNA methylase IME4